MRKTILRLIRPRIYFEKTGFTCRRCYNNWYLNEGFRIDTMKCESCQEWDDTKEEREKEFQHMKEWKKQNVNFSYCPGDPFW